MKTLEKPKEKKSTEEKKEEKDDTKKLSKSSKFDPGKELSISDKDLIKSQIAKCWTVPAGARDAASIKVLVKVIIEKDGTVQATELLDKVKYSSGDNFYRAAADSAIRAVKKCSPLKNLPQDKYDSWKELELNFDPKEMIY